MARAKRTERAEARRRYRAAAAADPENETAGGRVRRGRRRSTCRRLIGEVGRRGAGRSRTGFSQAFRQSFRPLNVREDLASLPWIAIHTKALWIPLADHLRQHRLHRRDGRQRHDLRVHVRVLHPDARRSAASSSPGSWPRASSWLLGVDHRVRVGDLLLDPDRGVPDDDPRRGRTADGLAGARRGHLRPDPVADHRRVLRRGCRLVPALPGDVEPEPAAQGEPDPEAEAGRRPHADPSVDRQAVLGAVTAIGAARDEGAGQPRPGHAPPGASVRRSGAASPASVRAAQARFEFCAASVRRASQLRRARHDRAGGRGRGPASRPFTREPDRSRRAAIGLAVGLVAVGLPL